MRVLSSIRSIASFGSVRRRASNCRGGSGSSPVASSVSGRHPKSPAWGAALLTAAAERNRRALSIVSAAMDVTYIGQEQAVKIDEELMGPLGFSVEQLMELAGLSVAASLADVYTPDKYPRILVFCGPGNNGGDGLVAARHLHHFGYHVKLCYPKPTDKALYNGLVTQCKALSLGFLSVEEALAGPLSEAADVVVDAMFGFSFRGEPRPPFDRILDALKPEAHPPPVVSVDIPSGWQVEAGDLSGGGIRPEMLVSLTAPKICARQFSGAYHYLGGRFVPPAIRDKYGLRLPPFPGTAQCVKLSGPDV